MVPPVERLKKRSEFLRVAATRRKWVTPGLILQGAPRNDAVAPAPSEPAPARVGFTVTKKVGKAVVRNRVRRRLRALMAELAPALALPGWDYVLIGRQATLERSFAALRDDLTQALARLPKARPGGGRRGRHGGEKRMSG